MVPSTLGAGWAANVLRTAVTTAVLPTRALLVPYSLRLPLVACRTRAPRMPYAWPSLPVPCACPTRALCVPWALSSPLRVQAIRVPYVCPARALHAHCACLMRVHSVPCTNPACHTRALRGPYACPACALRMSHAFPTRAPRVRYACLTRALRVPYACPTRALRVPYTYPSRGAPRVLGACPMPALARALRVFWFPLVDL